MQQEVISSLAIGALSPEDSAVILKSYMATKDFEQIQSSTLQEALSVEEPAVATPIPETTNAETTTAALQSPVTEKNAATDANISTPLETAEPAVSIPPQPNTSK